MTFCKLEGTFTEDDMMLVLVDILENFAALTAAQIAENEERNAERNLRNDQEREFEEALAADMERERQATRERASSDAAQAQKDMEEAIKMSMEAENEERIRRKRARIGEEPAVGPGVAKILFSLPDGTRVTRRFEYTETVEALHDFVESHLHDVGTHDVFKLVTTFPQMELKDQKQTVKDAGLTPSAQVLVTMHTPDDGSSDEDA